MLQENPARHVSLLKSIYGLSSGAGRLVITQKLAESGWKPMSKNQCLWCRYSENGGLSGAIGIHVDDFFAWSG